MFSFKKIALLLVVFFVAGCNGQFSVALCDRPDFRVAGVDVCVASEGYVDPEEIYKTIEMTDEFMKIYYPNLEGNLVEEISLRLEFIYFTHSKLSVNCVEIDNGIFSCETRASGVAVDWGRRIMIGSWNGGCLGYTSLGHEIIHVAEYIYFGHSLGDHEKPFLFDKHKTSELASLATVEELILMESVETFSSCLVKEQN